MFTYSDTEAKKSLYANNVAYFTNLNSKKCGEFSKCEVKDAGCVGAFTGEEVAIMSKTGQI